jgi:hypothetical protein
MSRLCREDLPSVSVSRLRAEGFIRAGDAFAAIHFADPDAPSAPMLEFSIALSLRRFRNGGNWSFFSCPRCVRRARRLWLLDGQPSCYWCCEARRVRGRAATLLRAERAIHRHPRARALFDGPPARLHPRPGRTIDRREQLDRSLRRAQMIERLHRLRSVEKALGAPRRGGAN